uniref:small ribosomal subunit protein uS11m isoform X3 n=1 Tax=Myxine glutinosa TaxID=7769 RepID=UPI00358E8016
MTSFSSVSLLRCWPVAFRRLFGSSSLHDAAEVTGNKSQSDDVEVIRSDSSIIPPMPDENSSRRWAGMKYEELPIVHIKASYNNTIIQVVYADGKAAALTSCGVEGFKNAKKTSVVAAQTTGLSAGTETKWKGDMARRSVGGYKLMHAESIEEKHHARSSCFQRNWARTFSSTQGSRYVWIASGVTNR